MSKTQPERDRRFRERKKAAGWIQLRIWVPAHLRQKIVDCVGELLDRLDQRA